MPRISYRSFFARTSFIVAALRSGPGFVDEDADEEDEEDELE